MKSVVTIILNFFAVCIFCLVFNFVIVRILPGGDKHFVQSSAFWQGPLLLITIGFLIAVAITFFNRGIINKERILFFGAAAGGVLFCIIAGSWRSYNWYHDRYEQNIEYNQAFLDETTTYPRPERIAFDAIIKKYDNKNNIRLAQKSVSSSDSIVAGKKVPYYSVEFTYWKKGIRNVLFESGCIVINDTAHLQYYEREMSKARKREYDSTVNSEMSDSAIKSIIKTYIDSTKNKKL
jgi:hypothetical protein